VESDQNFESLQISSDDHLLIIYTPGDLTIWYPDTNS